MVSKADIPQLPQNHGGSGDDMRKHPSKIPGPRYHVRRPRSPYPTFPLPRSPLLDWSEEAPGLRGRMQPGEPDDLDPWYPSQAVDYDDPRPRTTNHVGVLLLNSRDCRDRRDPCRPSSLQLSSSPPPLLSPASLSSPLPFASLSPVSPSTYVSSQPSSGRIQDHEPKTPYIIQIVHHNNKTHDNANRIHNGDNNSAIAQAQGNG